MVAWGEKGPVYVYHDKGLETQFMPVAPGVLLPTRPKRKEAKHDAFIQWTAEVTNELENDDDDDDEDCGATFEEVEADGKKWQVIKNSCSSGSITQDWQVKYDAAEWLQLEYTYPTD